MADMRRGTASTPTLSADQLGEVLALLPGVDSVELKLTVPDEHRRSTVTELGLDPLDAQLRQVVFFDTPDLLLNRAGVVARARRIQRRSGDTVIKLRPVVPDQLPAAQRELPGFGIEVDASPVGFVCSASLKAEVDDAKVREVLSGKRPVRKVFTKSQRSFFATHAPKGLELDSLAALGPINVLKLKFTPRDLGRRLVAELWSYPDGSRVLELSTKCQPSDAFQVAAETKAFLGSRGVDLSAPQQTKTRSALEFFSAELGPRASGH